MSLRTALSRSLAAPPVQRVAAPRAARSRTAVALLGLLLLAPMAGPGAALAAPAPSPSGSTSAPAPDASAGARWAVQPSSAKGPTGRNYFIYDLSPGDTLTDHVGVSNLSDRPLAFEVYGTDAYTTTDGAFALLPAAQTATDVGSWVQFEQRRWTVEPGRRADIPFRLTVPANATPGDHAGGVIGSIAQARTTQDGQRVLVDQRLAARIYLRVAGEVQPAVTVESVTVAYDNPINPLGGGDAVVTYTLRNSGNIRVAGTGAVTLAGPFGWELARTDPVELPELLPGATFTVTERITGVPPALRLTAEVDVRATTVDDPLPPVLRAAAVWAPPWLLLALVAALLGWFGVRWWRRRRARTTPGPTTGPTADSGPTASGDRPSGGGGA
ncbi:WxL protein peptidoglycan domain-containing protein [Micromonospora sp. SH-82]|uniref:WxL protein peptidoglycan domain-containing protein n=1 Tax=Micromonospora sp. SH-82 TaxID=3132938 RepID=UPI003EBEBD11